MKSQHIANIIIGITLIVTFINVYFFTAGIYLEKLVLNEQMDFVVGHLVGDVNKLSPDTAQILKSHVQSMQIPDTTQADKEIEDYNHNIMKNAMIIMAVTCVVGLAIAFAIVLIFGVPLKEFLITNSILFLFIAMTYFLFTFFIGRYYKSADPNFVRRKALESIKAFAGTMSASDKQKFTEYLLKKELGIDLNAIKSTQEKPTQEIMKPYQEQQ